MTTTVHRILLLSFHVTNHIPNATVVVNIYSINFKLLIYGILLYILHRCSHTCKKI